MWIYSEIYILIDSHANWLMQVIERFRPSDMYELNRILKKSHEHEVSPMSYWDILGIRLSTFAVKTDVYELGPYEYFVITQLITT